MRLPPRDATAPRTDRPTAWWRSPPLHLVAALLLTLLASPVIPNSSALAPVRDVLFCAVLVSAVRSLGVARRTVRVVSVLSVLVILPRLLLRSELGTLAPTAGAWILVALHFSLLALATFAMLRALVRARSVGFAEISAAVAVYLLFAAAWSLVYGVIDFVEGGRSFTTGAAADGEGLDSGRFVYFSVVTLTTLGYGDISPLTSAARSTAVVEALTGQLYIAILVARLVALEIAGPGESRTGASSQAVEGHVPMTFAHLTIATRDVARTVDFFAATLGWERIDRPANVDREVRWLRIAPGQELHVIQADDFEPTPLEREYGRHVAIFRRGAEFPELKARLERHGANLVAPERETPFERFFFRDPNGYLFEVIDGDGYRAET